MTLQPGTTLGDYTILGLIGVGGMGEVYKARDLKLGRNVAIKLLAAKLGKAAGSRSRLRREAKAAAAVTHPHICTLNQIAQEGNVDFLVMEDPEGDTLSNAGRPRPAAFRGRSSAR